jgi:hypothetical protein
MSKERRNCLCTAMLFDPKEIKPSAQDERGTLRSQSGIYERLLRLKKNMLMKKNNEKSPAQ